MDRKSWRWWRLVLLVGSLGLLAGGGWELGWWLQGGQRGEAPQVDFKIGPSNPVTLRPGLAREIPWWHGDMELTGRFRIPRGKHLDLVFRLQPGPATSHGDDRTAPLGPREWSALRLSAGDLGPPFLNARALPDGPGGARVAPDQPTDVRLIVRGRSARVEVGHEPLPETGQVWADRGVLALVGEGTVETLTARGLPTRLEPVSLGIGLGLALLVALCGGLVGWRFKAALLGLCLGAFLGAVGGWVLARTPSRPRAPDWTAEQAPSFARAHRLYGAPEAFRNWGAYAGLISWRGRTEFRLDPGGNRRILVLGGAQTWGAGVPLKASTFAMQVEGLLARHRREGKAGLTMVVAACRETDLPRQLRLLQEDLDRFGEEVLVLVCPASVLSRPEESLALLEELAGRLRAKGRGLLVLPPLVPVEAEEDRTFWEGLAKLAGERGFWLFDPQEVLGGLEGAFLDAGGQFRPDLSAVGHQALAPGIAAFLEKALGL